MRRCWRRCCGRSTRRETDSRLLVTSRFTFTLDGLEARLEDVQLRPLSQVAQREAAAPAAGTHPRRSGWPSGPRWPGGRWRSAGATPACRT